VSGGVLKGWLAACALTFARIVYYLGVVGKRLEVDEKLPQGWVLVEPSVLFEIVGAFVAENEVGDKSGTVRFTG
jgi:hypothetical protein